MKIDSNVLLKGYAQHYSKAGATPSFQQDFVALTLEGRTHVDTACAAYHLGRRPQTLRVWASAETGPLRPIRINGRLAWPVAEIRRVLQT
jgi:hypothetical protein